MNQMPDASSDGGGGGGGEMAPNGPRACSNKPRCNCHGPNCPHCNRLAKANDLRKKLKKPRLPNRQIAKAIKTRNNNNNNNLNQLRNNPFRNNAAANQRNRLANPNNRNGMGRMNAIGRGQQQPMQRAPGFGNDKTFASRYSGFNRNRRPNFSSQQQRMRPAGNFYRGAAPGMRRGGFGGGAGANRVCVGGR